LFHTSLHFGGDKGTNSWQQIIQEFTPDIVFAQESFSLNEYLLEDDLAQFKDHVWFPVPERKWGSAILSKNYQLEPISLPEYDGWVVGARIADLKIGGIEQSTMVFSIHAPSTKIPYERHVNLIIDEITKRWGNTPMILAGDFNLTTAAIMNPTEKLKNTDGEIKILDRLQSELGLINAWQHLHPNDDPPQTLRWTGNKTTPYHCDAIFLSETLLPHLVNAKIPHEIEKRQGGRVVGREKRREMPYSALFILMTTGLAWKPKLIRY